MKVRISPRIAIPAAIVLVFSLLGLFGALGVLENKVFDVFLAVKKPPQA